MHFPPDAPVSIHMNTKRKRSTPLNVIKEKADQATRLQPVEFPFTPEVPNIEGLSSEEVDDLAVKTFGDYFILFKDQTRDLDWDTFSHVISGLTRLAKMIWDGGHAKVAMTILTGCVSMLLKKGADLQFGRHGTGPKTL